MSLDLDVDVNSVTHWSFSDTTVMCSVKQSFLVITLDLSRRAAADCAVQYFAQHLTPKVIWHGWCNWLCLPFTVLLMPQVSLNVLCSYSLIFTCLVLDVLGEVLAVPLYYHTVSGIVLLISKTYGYLCIHYKVSFKQKNNLRTDYFFFFFKKLCENLGCRKLKKWKM